MRSVDAPAEAVRRLLQDVHQDLDGLVALVVPAMTERLPTYASAPPAFGDALPTIVRRNADRLLRQLLAPVDSPDLAAEQAHATGQLRAQQTIPLEEVLSAYRIGGNVLFEVLVERHRQSGQGTAEELLDAALLIWQEVDRESGLVVAGYRAAAQRHAGDRVRQQQALLEQLLSADTGTNRASIEAAAHELDLGTGPYRCAVVLSRADTNAPVPELTAMPTEVSAAWAVRGAARVGLLAGPRLRLTAMDHGPTPEPEHVVVLSPVFDGLFDLAAQYELTQYAAEGAPAGRIHQALSRLPQSLMAASPSVAAHIRQRTTGRLGELASGDGQLLVDTIRALLAANWSASGAARRLYCHRNTVLYRISRLRELLGEDFDTPETALLWSLALCDDWSGDDKTSR